MWKANFLLRPGLFKALSDGVIINPSPNPLSSRERLSDSPELHGSLVAELKSVYSQRVKVSTGFYSPSGSVQQYLPHSPRKCSLNTVHLDRSPLK